MSEYAFKMTASQLDAFQAYLDCEANYEKFFGHSEEPSLTYAEYEEQKFKELIEDYCFTEAAEILEKIEKTFSA